MYMSMGEKKVLVLTIASEEGASTRRRVLEYIPFLEAAGIRCTVKPLVPRKHFLKWGLRKERSKRLWLLLTETVLRSFHILQASFYDAVWVQKALFSTYWRGSARLLSLLNRNIIYDIDDAVFQGPMTELPGLLRALQDDRHIQKLVRISRQTIVGSPGLEAFARELTGRCTLIPTAVSLKKYRTKSHERTNDRVVIGWSGSDSTNENVNLVAPALVQVASRHHNVEFLIISSSMARIDMKRLEGVPVRFVPFRLPTFIDDLHRIDIGLMPLADTPWNRMKCGGKILEYMACGIPAVASPVGVNSTLIEHGRNGFLAFSKENWVGALEVLVQSPERREQMGLEGRKTIEREYSVEAQAGRVVGVFQEVLS
jgi:glycosyltransferase involved in cell wall biosynthesis